MDAIIQNRTLSCDVELRIALSNMRSLEKIMQQHNPAVDPEGFSVILHRLGDAYKEVMNFQSMVDVGEDDPFTLLLVDSSINSDESIFNSYTYE